MCELWTDSTEGLGLRAVSPWDLILALQPLRYHHRLGIQLGSLLRLESLLPGAAVHGRVEVVEALLGMLWFLWGESG